MIIDLGEHLKAERQDPEGKIMFKLLACNHIGQKLIRKTTNLIQAID